MSAIVDTLYANLEAEPDSWRCRLALIETLLIEHRPEEAIAQLDGVAGLPDDIDERVIAARAFGLIEPANGLPILEEILKVSPEHSGAHFETAFLSHRAGEIGIAAAHYYRAIALDPIFKDAKFEGKLLAALPAGDAARSPVDPRSKLEKAFEDGQEISFAGAGEPEGDRDSEPDHGLTEEKQEKFFPESGAIPVMTLRQAMAAEAARKPVVLRSNPRPVSLNFTREAKSRSLAFTLAPDHFRRIRKLRIQPRADQAAVDYDFGQPENSLFAASVTPDRILVGAPVTEDGIPVASLQESLRRRRQQRDPVIEKRIQKNKVQSLAIGLFAITAMAALMALITLGVARMRPPQIVAQTVARVEDRLETREIVKNRTLRQTVSDPSEMLSADFLKSAAVSALGVPSFEAPGNGLGLSDLGTHFGAGMDFAMSGSQFFGTRVQGNMAVVFDVTGSMHASIPVVTREIEARFRNAHVVVVHGSLFTDEGPTELMPYSENKRIQDMLGGFSIFSGTASDLDKALRGLRRCDSLEMNPETGYLQSLGRAIELLIKKKSAQTIFVFSDFQDGEDKAYLRKMAALARSSQVKVVFHHPTSFDDRATRKSYDAFAKEARGEVKEGGLGASRR